MGLRNVIFLAGTDLLLFAADKQTVAFVGSFANTAAGIDGVVDRINGKPETLTYLLVDTIDESYHLGNIPHVGAKDRRQVLERHVARLYAKTPFRHGEIQGRETQNRRDDIVMASAITNEELLAPLLKRLAAAKIALAGILSVPAILGDLIRFVDKKPKQAMVVAELASGLRASYFSDRKLKVSRLASIRRGTADERAKSIVEEVDKTHKYLGRLRLSSWDSAVTALIFADSEIIVDLAQYCRDTREIKYELIDVDSLLDRSRVSGEGVSPIHHVIVDSAMHRVIQNHYATKTHLHFARLYTGVRHMRAASRVVVAAGLLGAGLSLVMGNALESERDRARNETTVVEHRATAIEATLPATAVSPEVIKASVVTVDKLDAIRLTPNSLLYSVSQVLGKFQNLKIDAVNWQALWPEDIAAHPPEFLPPDAPENNGDVLDGEGKFHVKQVATLQGHLAKFSGNYKAAVAYLSQFVAGLKATGAYEYVILKRAPIMLQPDRTTEGASGYAEQKDLTAEFVIDVVMDKSYEP